MSARFTLDQIAKMPPRIQAQIYAQNEAAQRAAIAIKPGTSQTGPSSLLGELPPARKISRQAHKQDESRSQQEVIRWFRDNCYEWELEEEFLMAFPLQGARSARNGSRMKAEGMRRGTPDMLLAVPRGDCCALWIEMKSPRGYLNPFQKVMLARLTKAGAATVVCRSSQEAQAAIRAYLNLPTKK